jgi:predicted alpha/beta superfamily hydrolase
VRGGQDVVLNVPVEGEYRLVLDLGRGTWEVSCDSRQPGPEGALEPLSALRGSLAPLFAALRRGGQGRPYGYCWERAGLVRSFLELGSWSGFLPLREDNRVLFVHRGALPAPLYLAGSMNGWQAGLDRFEPVPGSDVHLLYREFAPGSLHHYKLHCSGFWLTDPLNPWVVPDGCPIPLFQTGEFNSVLDLGRAPNERGDPLLRLRFSSVLRGNERDIYVWLPPGYAREPERRYPVLYVQDGNEAVTRVWLHRRARQAVESGLTRPCILVFVALASQQERNYEYTDRRGREEYAAMLVRELVPFIDGHFRTRPEHRFRGIAGASYGGAFSYFAAWRYPDTFGCVAGQGASFHVRNFELLDLYVRWPRRHLLLYMDSACPTAPGRPRDNHHCTCHAEQVLGAAGYRLRHLQRRDQPHDWPSWAERFPELLRTFWPAE